MKIAARKEYKIFRKLLGGLERAAAHARKGIIFPTVHPETRALVLRTEREMPGAGGERKGPGQMRGEGTCGLGLDLIARNAGRNSENGPGSIFAK